MILDATFLIDLIAGDPAATAKLEEMSDRLLAVPTLAYTEVGVGIRPDTAEARRFEAVMAQLTLVPYDAEAARRAVDVQRGLHEQGDAIGAIDAMIAGIAIARDEPILTRNVGEFKRTPARVSPY